MGCLFIPSTCLSVLIVFASEINKNRWAKSDKYICSLTEGYLTELDEVANTLD